MGSAPSTATSLRAAGRPRACPFAQPTAAFCWCDASAADPLGARWSTRRGAAKATAVRCRAEQALPADGFQECSAPTSPRSINPPASGEAAAAWSGLLWPPAHVSPRETEADGADYQKPAGEPCRQHGGGDARPPKQEKPDTGEWKRPHCRERHELRARGAPPAPATQQPQGQSEMAAAAQQDIHAVPKLMEHKPCGRGSTDLRYPILNPRAPSSRPPRPQLWEGERLARLRSAGATNARHPPTLEDEAIGCDPSAPQSEDA